MIDWPEGVRGTILQTVDSTNREAERRAAAGEAGPMWIAAREQKNGRGRQGRGWESPEGNLYATHLAAFDGALVDAALTGFAAALAVADMVAAFAPVADVRLKWPNDVLLNGAKVSGILLESFAASPPRLAIGIGINLSDAPPTHVTRWRATSLRAEIGHTPGFDQALGALAQAMSHWLGTLVHQGFAPVRDAWLARAAHLGEQIEVRLPAETVTGLFADLDADGALVLDIGARTRRIAAGDVFLPGGA